MSSSLLTEQTKIMIPMNMCFITEYKKVDFKEILFVLLAIKCDWLKLCLLELFGVQPPRLQNMSIWFHYKLRNTFKLLYLVQDFNSIQ